VQAQVCDLEANQLPFDKESMDVVFTGETIEHQVDTDWFLANINRVLKPGGFLVMTFPNVRTITGIAMMLLADLPPMFSARYRSGHFRDFTLRTMKIALEKNGFEIVAAKGSDMYFPGLGYRFSGLASLLPSWSSNIVVKAVKRRTAQYRPEDVAQTEIYS
jgi:SAM-dependent methyltransferase